MKKLSARSFLRRYLARPTSIAAEHDILTFSLVLKAKPIGDDGDLVVTSLATAEQIGVSGMGKALLVEHLAAIVARLQQELALQQTAGQLAVATHDVSAVQEFTNTMTTVQSLVPVLDQLSREADAEFLRRLRKPVNEALPDEQS